MELSQEIRSSRRLRHLARIGVFWALVIFGKLVYLQVFQHGDLHKRAAHQHNGAKEIPAPRGRIYDRAGQTLAISVPADSVSINPKLTPDIDLACEIFAPALSLNPEELQARLARAVETKRGFLWIKRNITPEESARIRGLKLGWVDLTRDSVRRYPKGPLASNLIGNVNFEGSGAGGLELGANQDLTGRPGLATRLVDAQGRAIESRTVRPPRPGKDIGLSLDERIQFMADRQLAAAVKATGSQSGTVVVLNPHNGEILAMSSWPTFDPSAKLLPGQGLSSRLNHAISAPFEPGSVFKIFTLAAALETTHLRPESMIDCGPGVMRLFGRRIRDIHAYNTIPMEKVLAKSSNIGAIRIGMQVGEPKLYEYITNFGFGARTGIPLPAESAGKVRQLRHWQKTSIGSVPMGHELSTTALQLALGVAAIANEGVLPKPRLILWRQEPGGPRKEEPIEPGRRVIQATTSLTMRRMMEKVVLEGTGRAARLVGYTAGGKTGSAQIYDTAIRRYTHKYNSSFAGFAPIQNPAIVVTVTLNGATRYGGLVSAPVFQKIATDALRILGVVPDVPLEEERGREVGPTEEEVADLPDTHLTDSPAYEEAKIPAEVRAALDIPETAALPVKLARNVEAASGGAAGDEEVPPTEFITGQAVPNFKGKSLRAVVRECNQLRIELEYSGAGIARWQYPPAGSALLAGKGIRVVFAR